MRSIRAVTCWALLLCAKALEQVGRNNNSFTRIAKALRERTKIVKEFIAVVEKGDAAKAAPFLEEKPTLVRLRDEKSRTLLMKASNISDTSRSVQMVKLLLDAGAQATIAAIDSKSTTALMYAAQRGHLETVALLLERPVSAASAATVKDATGEVGALVGAVETGRLEQVQKLISGDALTGVDSAGRTALMKVSAIADAERSFEGAKLLLKLGAKAVINVLDYEGKSALVHAAERGNLETSQLLKDHGGSLGPRVALLPPKDIFQVTNLTEMNMTKRGCNRNRLPKICEGGKFFCFDPERFEERFGELDMGSGETKFRAFAKGRSGWIRVFHNYNTRGEDCECASCGRWDPANSAAEKDWAPGDVILHQAANYWPMGSRIRIVNGSRYSHHHTDEGTCATLTANHYEGAGYREVSFEDGLNYSYEFKDFEPCSEVMPFEVDFGECKADPDHCVMSPNFPKNYSDQGECSVQVRTPAMLHTVAFRVGTGDSLEWQQEAPLNPTAKLVWDGVYNLFGLEPSGEKHNVTAKRDFKPFQTPVQIMPWLHWSPNGAGQGWRICEALIDWRDVNGETAAMKAIDLRSRQGLDVLKHLLNKKASVEGGNKTGQTAMMKACDQPDEKLALEAVGLLFNSSNTQLILLAVDNKGRTALMYAVMRCSISLVSALLEHSASGAKDLASRVDDDGKGALLHAIERCSMPMVEVLVQALGGEEEVAAEMHKDNTNKTTIMYAAQRSSTEILSYLIQLYKSKLRIGQLQIPLPVTGLALPSSGKLADVAITYENFVNSRDSKSRSALSYAAQHGHLQNIQLLKGHGAKMTEVSATGKTVLMYAVESGDSETVKHLLESEDMEQLLDKMDDQNRTALMYAAGSSNETTTILIGKGANISARDANGMSVLMHAAQGGKAAVVSTVLRHAPSVQGGVRPASAGSLRALLLEPKGDAEEEDPLDMVGWRDKKGATALLYASKISPKDPDRDAVAVVQRLVEAKADVGQGDFCLFTPLMASAERGYHETVVALLDACQNDSEVINARDGYFGFEPLKKGCVSPPWGMKFVWGEWRTALWLASSKGHKGVVNHLIHRKADTLLRNRGRMLPIEVAQKNGHFDVVASLRFKDPSFRERVSRTIHFDDFKLCLAISLGASVVCVCCLICCCAALDTVTDGNDGAGANGAGAGGAGASAGAGPNGNGASRAVAGASTGAGGAANGDGNSVGVSNGGDGAGARLLEQAPGLGWNKRGPIILAARAVRFKQKQRQREAGEPRRTGGWLCCGPCRRNAGYTSRRKLTYALNVCANVLMPFGPLMYFTDPDIVVGCWLFLYFVLPVLFAFFKEGCCSCRCRDRCRSVAAVVLKLWQFPSLAMTGKYLCYPWILRWLRPRLLIFLVTFSQLVMNTPFIGRPVSRPSAALVFDDHTIFLPTTAFGLYTLFLAIISIGAILWRTDVIPFFADIFTLSWVMFGTDIFGPASKQTSGWMALLPCYPACLYMVHIYWMCKKDAKVGREWWNDQFDEYERELQALHDQLRDPTGLNGQPAEATRLNGQAPEATGLHGQPPEATGLNGQPPAATDYDRIMSLASEIYAFSRLDVEEEVRTEAERLEDEEDVRFWHCSLCNCDRPFGACERIFFHWCSMYFDVLTIVQLLLADRFAFAAVLLVVLISSVLLHLFLWLGNVLHCRGESRGVAEDESGCCDWLVRQLSKHWDRLFYKGVPTVGFLKWIDRAHGFQDFFSLCVTLRSLPLIGKKWHWMLHQIISIAMSTWGLTTFLFEKIELEITELYYDSGWHWWSLVRQRP